MTATPKPDVEATADEVRENETRVQDLAARFVAARDKLAELNAESDPRHTSSSVFIAAEATAEELVKDAAAALEKARADLANAREAHHEALVAAYQAARPAILQERHELAGKADGLIAELNEILEEVLELSMKDLMARREAGLDGPDTLRQDKLCASWVIANLPALRTLRGPGSSPVYPGARNELADLYQPHQEES